MINTCWLFRATIFILSAWGRSALLSCYHTCSVLFVPCWGLLIRRLVQLNRRTIMLFWVYSCVWDHFHLYGKVLVELQKQRWLAANIFLYLGPCSYEQWGPILTQSQSWLAALLCPSGRGHSHLHSEILGGYLHYFSYPEIICEGNVTDQNIWVSYSTDIAILQRAISISIFVIRS